MINFSPRVWKNRQEAWEMQDLLFKERCLFLNTAIEQESALAICQQLMVLAQDNAEMPIKLHLMSPGGSVNSALAMVDTIQTIKPPVETIVMGFAASAAALTLAAGAKGKRKATYNSRIMIHQVASRTEGKLEDMMVQIKETQALDEILNEMLAKFTGKTKKEIQEAIKKDNYMSPQEAKEFGLIDEIVPWTKTW